MKRISFEELLASIKSVDFPKFDMIVAIGSGGIILGGIVQNKLKIPMEIIWIQFRDKNNKIKYEKPRIISTLNINNKKILIVDDVARTGATLKVATDALAGNDTKTFVFNGKADYSIMDSEECVKLPWQ